jgi:hypothetical protein
LTITKPIDLIRRAVLPRIANPGALHQRILIVRLIPLLGAQEIAIAKERHAHAAFDLVVAELLMQVDFKRTIGDEDGVAIEERVLHLFVQKVGERGKFDRLVNAAACDGRLLPAEMLGVGAFTPLRGDDQIAQSLRSRAVRHLKRRVASNRCQGQPRTIVGCKRGRNVVHERRVNLRRRAFPPTAA